MIVAIVACEIGFWVLLVAGLAARYLLKARALSTALLVSVPLVDVALLAFSVVDLRRGGEPTTAHALAAVYLGVSVAFGHQMIRWADQRFAHRFAGGPPPVKPPKGGPEHAAYERRMWLRHLMAYGIAALILGLFTLLIGADLSEPGRAPALWNVMRIWGLVLIIDGIVAFSYTFKRRPISSAKDR
ncbi:2TM domain-containing protein [Actinoplanes bogorensis]|uniref:2TM domain-containing protein n=1 Tax=Paractinoplanes bogorensis TaxID=1610840 RepID=A0ABS5Z445_9ACTN|nr:2TM domain-containing protein [Actinoplanes bogorensis]MBU2670467.1 2TM domain-containing protein [Actinoplanes bogorensis]